MRKCARNVQHADVALRQAIRLVLHVGAWLDEQVRPPRGEAGISPARITVLTAERPQTLVQQSRRL
jgi:hypothetical protein